MTFVEAMPESIATTRSPRRATGATPGSDPSTVPERLHEAVEAGGFSAHDVYHAGQIQWIERLVRRRPFDTKFV